jgi:hypothetical protein
MDGYNVFQISYEARSDLPWMYLRSNARTYSQYVVGVEYWLVARWDWDDVVFTCMDQRTMVDAGLFIHVIGAASGFTQTFPTAPMGRVELYLGHPQYFYTQGIWRAASNNGGSAVPEPVSTGVFAGSTGDALNQTVTYLLGESPTGRVPTGVPVRVNPMFTLAVETRNEIVNGEFPSISLQGSPVFNLPPGCTCNSPSMGVVDNELVTSQVEPQAWGRIKNLFR